MGVLKVVLAVLGTLQLVIAVLYADKGFHAHQNDILFGGSRGGEEALAMLMELQSPFYLAMAAMNILSWKMGSSIRPLVAVVNIICLLGVSVVHYRHARHYAFPPFTTPVCVALLGLIAVGVGLMIHQLEPGLLTEDKNKKDVNKES